MMPHQHIEWSLSYTDIHALQLDVMLKADMSLLSSVALAFSEDISSTSSLKEVFR